MKIILLEDVVGTGNAGDVVEVKNGYARNKLLPSGVAIEANKANMNTLEHRRAKIAAKKAADVDIAKDLADRLDGKQVDFIAKAGEAGKLFGSITAHDIAAAVTATTGFEIDRRKLLLDAPIKQIGLHDVRYRIYAEVEAVIKVNILAEGGSASAGTQEELEIEIVDIKPEGEEAAAPEEEFDIEEDTVNEEGIIYYDPVNIGIQAAYSYYCEINAISEIEAESLRGSMITENTVVRPNSTLYEAEFLTELYEASYDRFYIYEAEDAFYLYCRRSMLAENDESWVEYKGAMISELRTDTYLEYLTENSQKLSVVENSGARRYFSINKASEDI